MDPLARAGFDLQGYLSAATSSWVGASKTIAEMIVIAYALLWLWGRIRGTQSERLVKGIFVLVAICIVTWLAGFSLITFILQQLIPVALLALVIIFQPEIRRGLGHLGRGKRFRLDLYLGDTPRERAKQVIEQIIIAVRELSRTRIGALVVIEPAEAERDYLSPGVPVNADVTSNLLLSIFFPNSPLHDGAVVIRKDKIVAAGVILPMTDNPKLSYRYGTRHRAAIGLSELHDTLCIVVSEETGHISAASRGMLVRYSSADELYQPLSYIYEQVNDQTPNPLRTLLSLFGRARQSSSDIEYGIAGVPSEGSPAETSSAIGEDAAAPSPSDVEREAHSGAMIKSSESMEPGTEQAR